MTFWRLAAAALVLFVVGAAVFHIRETDRELPQPSTAPLSAVAALGQRIFFDASLSASGKMSCATCHSPRHAYGPPNSLAVQSGGADLQRSGLRAVPSLRYHENTPSFSIGPTDSTPDNDDSPSPPGGAGVSPAGGMRGIRGRGRNSQRNSLASANKSANYYPVPEFPAFPPPLTPQGGLAWDGRADTFQGQALAPFLDPNEMALRDSDELLTKLQRTPYAEDFKTLFGAHVFEQADLVLNEALFAVGRFQIEDSSFHPYDSRYDRYLAGVESLTPQERRGLALFEDSKKGNCASCHISRPSRDGRFPPAFTDYEFEALGAPRNLEIPANRDPAHFDLGLCGPLRTDFRATAAYCGLFKTPTLRNVATRSVFFHNGVFHSLEDVLKFYVERETHPERWYPRNARGEVEKYDDLPARYRENVDRVDAPFDRKARESPALDAAEIADLAAFLKTLTDRDLESR